MFNLEINLEELHDLVFCLGDAEHGAGVYQVDGVVWQVIWRV